MMESLSLESLVTEDGRLRLSVASVEAPQPGPEEVLVRVEATPINPTDLTVLLASADISTLRAVGEGDRPAVTADIPERAFKRHRGRIGRPMVAGYEGAGTVIDAGASRAARALLGKTVSMTGGEMFRQHRCVRAADVMVMEHGTTAREAASGIVNPMTVLGFMETLRLEGHTALVHTAAASNLGQMLNRLCIDEGVGLVNIVRRPEQVALLREQGAEYAVDSSAGDFRPRLIEAIAATGATLAFDAVGGGRLANTILSCMERAAARDGPTGHYGTEVFKQIYIYGRLDLAPTELTAAYGFAWSVGGWLMGRFLRRTDPERVAELRRKVAAEIKTIFASRYAAEVSFEQALNPEAIARYSRLSTGGKYLINPNAGRP